MSIQLTSLKPEQLNYLQRKWASELTELKGLIAKRKQVLAQLLDRREVWQEEMTAIEIDLDTAKEILEHLQAHGSNDKLMAAQTAVVDDLDEALESALGISNRKTDEELMLEQMEIDYLEKRKELLQQRIAAIDTILKQ